MVAAVIVRRCRERGMRLLPPGVTTYPAPLTGIGGEPESGGAHD